MATQIQVTRNYRRVWLNQTAFGFMRGSSVTAAIEATLVYGAQRARSLTVFFLPVASVR